MKKPTLLIALLSAFAAPAMATMFIAQFVSPTDVNASTPGPRSPGLPTGLHVQVIDGAIVLNNAGGSQNFSAGQFGYTANIATPPVVLPSNPGLRFAPPPVFNSASASGPASANGTPARTDSVDCEVR